MGSTLGTATSPRTFEPAVDVRSNDDELLLICDVPGFKNDDLEITITNHILTVQGTRKFESNDGEQVMLGRSYGSFRRSFGLPALVDEERLTADLESGSPPRHGHHTPVSLRDAPRARGSPVSQNLPRPNCETACRQPVADRSMTGWGAGARRHSAFCLQPPIGLDNMRTAGNGGGRCPLQIRRWPCVKRRLRRAARCTSRSRPAYSLLV